MKTIKTKILMKNKKKLPKKSMEVYILCCDKSRIKSPKMANHHKFPQICAEDCDLLTLFSTRGGQKGPPYQLSPVTSTNVIPSTSPKLLNLNQDRLPKKQFFWSNPYKIEIMITSLIEMLDSSNFDHIITSTIKFESHDKILLVMSWT